MSTTTTAPAPTDDPTAAPSSGRPGLPRLGGAALLLTPLLMTGAMVTTPQQKSQASADYIESLARDPQLTALSAGLYHYGWIALAFGVLAAVTLVPGARGRRLTAVGAVASAFGAMQFSGLLFNDWFLSALGNGLPLPEAVEIFEAMGDGWVASWLLSAKLFGLAGLPVLLSGLARAGVVGWWTVPVALAPMPLGAVAFLVAGPVGGVPVALLAWSSVILVGLRLVRRPAVPAGV